MSEQEYETKLASLRRYIPFLVNMMSELKTKGNREAQLNKIQSLHDMITDSRKKLKLETLNRCEEVLTNIYFKVNPQMKVKGLPMFADTLVPEEPRLKNLPGIESPKYTPASPSPPRDIFRTKPVNIPTEKIDTPYIGTGSLSAKKSHLPKINVYSNVVINSTKPTSPDMVAKVPDMSKPPISLDDLKTLEDDVQQKISDATYANASVDDLNAYRKELELQLRIVSVTSTMSPEKAARGPINTTVRNNPSLAKKLPFAESKSGADESPKAAKNPTSPIKEIKTPTLDKKSPKDKTDATSPKTSTQNKPPQKVLKDSAGMFGSLLSSIDDQILEDKKKIKKSDRRSSINSKEDSASTTSLSSDKSDSKGTDVKSKHGGDKSKESKHKDSGSPHKHRRSSVDKEKHKHRDKSKDKPKKDNKKSKKNKKKDKKDKHRSAERKGEEDKSAKKELSKGEDKTDPDSEVKKKSSTPLLSDILLFRSKLHNKNANSDDGKEVSSTSSSSTTNRDCDKTTVSNTIYDILTDSKSDFATPSTTNAEQNKSEATQDMPKASPVYKRLADKYNPKPKSKPVEAEIPDVDKAVSDSIENLMKVSPAKALLSPLGEPKLSENVLQSTPQPNAIGLSTEATTTRPVQLPDILQKIFSKPLLGELIPKRFHENPFPLTSAAQNNALNTGMNIMTKPGAIQPAEPPILSPPRRPHLGQPSEPNILSATHRPISFQPPEGPRSFQNFMSPTQRQEFIPPNHDMVARPNALLLPPTSQHGLLPTPPVPPALPLGFSDHNPMMDMGYGTPRVDFDTPSTPMPDFGSPRVDFEAPTHLRNEQFNINQRFIPPLHQERPMNCFDPRNQNFMAPQFQPPQSEMNVYNNQLMSFYNPGNQMHLLSPEVPLYMADQNFYQERAWHENARWGRRPGDPRNYKEYKEMRERQEREAKAAQEKQKEIKDPRLAPRDAKDGAGEKEVVVRDPRLIRDVDRSVGDKSEAAARDPRLFRGREKSVDREHNSDNALERDKNRDLREKGEPDLRGRDYKAKGRDIEPRQRPRSRERAISRLGDLAESRDSRSRGRESRFDKMYSRTNKGQSQSQIDDDNEEEEAFVSPLDSLYNAGEKGKTGRGYGVQKFKIPRKSRIDDVKRTNDKRDERRSGSVGRKKRYIEISDSSDDSDTNQADNSVPDNDSDVEYVEEYKFDKLKDTKKKSENQTKESSKDLKKSEEESQESGVDTSRIKVIIKADKKDDIKLDTWKNDSKSEMAAEDSDFSNFVSEYDKEFQLENKRKPSVATVSEEKPTDHIDDAKRVDRSDVHAKVTDVQVEEPSSSQDVTEDKSKKSPLKAEASIEKRPDEPLEVDSSKKSDGASLPKELHQKNLTESVEADSSKKSDGSLTPQEPTAKSDEPSEQNILAHFFENLLKSKNKKDKKTALFSLIETFSDSFDTREIQKIRKIIKADEDEEEESDDEEKESRGVTENKDDSKAVASVQEEQPVVGSTTEEVSLENNETKVSEINTTEDSLKITETQVNEVSKSSEEVDQPRTEQTSSEEFLNQSATSVFLEPVVVSVGERIKNRKRNVTPKPRKKGKTELDLLHEDIQDMFIRDGVLTATGKRMCRILKDDPTVLAVAQEEAPLEQKKVRKKPGPKPKPKINKDEVVQTSMKDMRIVIKKMPDNVLTLNTSSTRQLRSRKRLSSYAESDDDQKDKTDLEPTHQLRARNLQSSYAESDNDSQNEVDTGLPEDNESMKSEIEGESTSDSEDDNKSHNSDGGPKPRVVRRRRGAKWASGIIPKIKKKKPQNKSQENSPVLSRASSPDANNALMEHDFDKLVDPDKEYYYDYASKTKMRCKLCNYSGHLLTGHYLKEHPQSEVLCSRLAPHVATEAIRDFSVNGNKYESITITKISTKYHYSCRVCGFTSVTSPIFFYEHVTTHTGEYRHQCGICEYFAVTGKTMNGHFLSAHPDQEKKAIRRTYTLAVVFGYICGECNFLQLKQKSVEDHVNIFHLGDKPIIYKINMSTILDSVFDTYLPKETPKALEHKLTDVSIAPLEDAAPSESATDNEGTGLTPSTPPKARKKPNPKPKVPKEKKVADKNKVNESPSPVLRKKPGPKSKTVFLATIEQDNTAENVMEAPPANPIDNNSETLPPIPKIPPATPVRKKPGPKSKTLKSKPPTADEQPQNENIPLEKEVAPTPTTLENAAEATKEAPARKRRRSIDKLIPEDSRDDLDTIITLSSRSSRAAKDKASAKLKTLMESNEGLSTRKRFGTDSTRKENDKEKSQVDEAVVDRHNEMEKEPSKEIQGEKDKPIETPSETQVAEMHPPLVKEKPTEKKDLNVFTCKTDILEEEETKKIEAERLRKMEELNKSIGSRTSKLDFVDKLSNRLNSEQSSEKPKVAVKQEPKDNDLALNAATSRADTPTMPVLQRELPQPVTKTPPLTKVSKSPVVSKKPVLEDDRPLPQSSINFKQNKPNSLFSNMIEKLQGKVNEAAVQQEDSGTNVQSANEEGSSSNRSSTPEVLISIGDLISATKRDNEIIYCCHANNCYVATKDKMVFQLHCKFGHKDLGITSSLCEKCGVVIEITPDTSLLENLNDHLIFAHSDCLSKSSSLRMRRLSGDKLSVKQERSEKAPANPPSKVKVTQEGAQDFEASLDSHILTLVSREPSIHTVTKHGSSETEHTPERTEATQEPIAPVPMETEPTPDVSAPADVEPSNEEPAALEATLELAEDNPFSFKIANVVSLAQSGESEDQTQSPPNQNKPKPPELPPLKPVPPLTLITIPKQQPSTQPNHLIVKEAKLTLAELSRPKKAPKAWQKFIDTPGDLYKCPHFYCMFTTNNRMFLERHLNAHKRGSEVMVPCVYCDMKTPWEHVPVHIDIRHASCRYACTHCLYRAFLKEYVCLHQEQAHPDKDFVILSLPTHKAAKKFSVADAKLDCKTLCEPYKCMCTGEDGKQKEFLFETEFINHLKVVHQNRFTYCAYPGCAHRINSSLMPNHWAMFHGICTYQCSYCKTSSKDISRMYSHLSLMHPSSPSDILVRINDNLPKDKELGYSKEAFAKLGHIRKIPQNLLAAIGKRSQRSIKLIHFDGVSEESTASPSSSESTPTASVPSTTGGGEKLYLVPASMVSPPKGQTVTSMAPISKVVAQTSSASKAIADRPGGESVLAVEAAQSLPKVTVASITSSSLPQIPVQIGDTAIQPVSQTRVFSTTTTTTSSHATIAVLSRSLIAGSVTTHARSLVKPGASKTGTDSNETPQRTGSPVIKIVSSTASALPQTKTVTVTTPAQPKSSANKGIRPTTDASDFADPASQDATSQDSSTGLSEDDILQSAIQSILDADDFSESNSNAAPASYMFTADSSANAEDVESSPMRPSTPSFSSVSSTVPPPLVLISSSSKSDNATPEVTASESQDDLLAFNEPTAIQEQSDSGATDQIAPVEHIDVAGDLAESSLASEDVDPLNIDGSEDSNLGPALFDDINIGMDSPPEDPLTIIPTLNSELPAIDDPLSIDDAAIGVDPLDIDSEQGRESANQSATESPLLIAGTRRSMSMVSNSDDESDSSSSEKGKKRGLMGYQLYRCISCNLSFSNVQMFKSHLANTPRCKKPGGKPYQCVHCEKALTTVQRLADHIQYHGVPRFTCSLCNEKFPILGIAKLHLKNRHNILQTNLIPLKSNRTHMDTDEFMVKPGQANQSMKDKETTCESPKLTVEDNTFNPDQIDSIPIRQIFSSNVKCGKCNYQTKVRVNIVRHLQMHLEEKAVPDTAPVNPVPCLEKNEKMFDKMFNLAASSITTSTGRMGSGQEKEREEEKNPEYIPSHRRFVCTANGCSYLCPEEANLRHHLAALHSDDAEFTCAHCKKKIEPADPDSVLKHLKLHGLHLYKCHYCSFVHHLKHKVERHVTDGHLDAAVKVVTVRFMESEPQEFGSTEELATPSPAATTKFKPWRCCMCKVKCHTREDMQQHIVHKHDIDTQYKCTLCTFKNDKQGGFRDHFKEKHPNNEIDVIYVYQKVEEEIPKDDTYVTPFDTTPLWQRDKPRVRHIRGILFDETSPQPTKSPKKPPKTYGPSPKASSSSSTTNSPNSTHNAPTILNKNLFDCIDAVARGTAGKLQGKIEVSAGTAKGTGFSDAAKGSGAGVKEKGAPLKEKGAPVKEKGAAVKEKGASVKEKGATVKERGAVKEKGAPVKEKRASIGQNEGKKIVSETKGSSGIKQEDIQNEDDDVVEIKLTPSIIVIDSDSDTEATPVPKIDETKDKDSKSEDKDIKPQPVPKSKPLKRQSTTDLLQEAVKMAKIEEPDDEDSIMATNCSKEHLISIYGALGVPHNKQWKCPKCHQFKSKRVGDFMFHIYKDFNVYRYKCKACSDLSITYKYMLDHITLHPGFTEDIIEALSPNVKLETWIHMVIREQSLAILKNAPLMKKRPVTGPTDIGCYFCNDRFMSMPECYEHMLYHWVMMPYQCQHCPHEFYTVYDLKHHHKIEHADLKLYLDPKGPTLAKAISCIEVLRKRPAPKPAPPSPPRKKAKVDDGKDAEAAKESEDGGSTSAAVVTVSPTTSTGGVIRIEDDDDLVIVSKIESTVSNDDEVYACDVCPYMTDTEEAIVKHLQQAHGVKANKYHHLSKKNADVPRYQDLACNICDKVFSELNLRRHFLDNHLNQYYSPYRYKCEICMENYLSLSKVKVHFTRCHPDIPLQARCVISDTVKCPALSHNRLYTCTMCSYTSVSPNPASIRAHLRAHLRPILCKHCNNRFRYCSEVTAHTAKEHPELTLDFVTLDDVQREFAETLKEISRKATLVAVTGAAGTAKKTANSVKNLAKKSTAAPFTSPTRTHSEEGEYSYYGVPPAEVDVANIVTTFELEGLEYTTTAEQMMKMFNMETYVDVSDCAVNILPLDRS